MVQEGSFQLNRYNDALTTFIGIAEHSGRVREFSGAGVKAVYGKGSKGNGEANSRHASVNLSCKMHWDNRGRS
jgi:hypothetical protein